MTAVPHPALTPAPAPLLQVHRVKFFSYFGGDFQSTFRAVKEPEQHTLSLSVHTSELFHRHCMEFRLQPLGEGCLVEYVNVSHPKMLPPPGVRWLLHNMLKTSAERMLKDLVLHAAGQVRQAHGALVNHSSA